MTISQFSSQCAVSSIELSDGYLVTVRHDPTGICITKKGKAISPVAWSVLPRLAAKVFNMELKYPPQE